MVGLSSEFGIWNACFFLVKLVGKTRENVTQTRQVGHEAYRCRNSWSPESLHQVAIPLCCCHSFLGSEKLRNSWFPLIGGIYTPLIIYCLLGDYMLPTHPLWEPERTIELSAKVEFGCVLRLFSRLLAAKFPWGLQHWDHRQVLWSHHEAGKFSMKPWKTLHEFVVQETLLMFWCIKLLKFQIVGLLVLVTEVTEGLFFQRRQLFFW